MATKQSKITTIIRVFVCSKYGFAPFCDEHLKFPEEHKMPKQAVSSIKKYVDNFLKKPVSFGSSEKVLAVETVSSDVVNFIYEYGEYKGYKTEIYYRNRRIGIEGVFGKFNTVFNYIDKLTHKSDRY
jgi:hypothetical protein